MGEEALDLPGGRGRDDLFHDGDRLEQADREHAVGARVPVSGAAVRDELYRRGGNFAVVRRVGGHGERRRLLVDARELTRLPRRK